MCVLGERSNWTHISGSFVYLIFFFPQEPVLGLRRKKLFLEVRAPLGVIVQLELRLQAFTWVDLLLCAFSVCISFE